jgi:hypothetical protein
MEDIVMKKVCSVCGSKEVQVMAWIDINSKKMVQIPDKPKVWCDDCCNHTKPIDELSYHKK